MAPPGIARQQTDRHGPTWNSHTTNRHTWPTWNCQTTAEQVKHGQSLDKAGDRPSLSPGSAGVDIQDGSVANHASHHQHAQEEHGREHSVGVPGIQLGEVVVCRYSRPWVHGAVSGSVGAGEVARPSDGAANAVGVIVATRHVELG